MIWLHPFAAIALLAVALPVVIHVLVRQRATRVPFPTLRFIQPHRLSSVRRHALEDLALLAVRAAILALAAAAIAGPFLTNAARRRAWDARTIRADVTDADVAVGLARAIAWLDRQPPARREIVVRGPLLIGTLTAADIAAIPAPIGLRFERSVTAPASRSLPATAVAQDGRVVERETTLSGERTSVRDVRASAAALLDIELAGPPDQGDAVDQLRRSLQTERVALPLANRTARVVFADTMRSAEGQSSASTPWMADAAARIARDTNGNVNLRFRFEGQRLVILTDMAPTDSRAMTLVRTVARGLGPTIERAADEIVPIPDAQLAAWTREAGPASVPTREMIDRDDRRWLWAAVLLLMALESWLRRSRKTAAAKESARAA